MGHGVEGVGRDGQGRLRGMDTCSTSFPELDRCSGDRDPESYRKPCTIQKLFINNLLSK